MNSKRRKIIKYAGVATLATIAETAELLISEGPLAAGWKRELFKNRNLTEVLSGVSNGVDALVPTDDIVIKAPGLAENGHRLPVEVTSKLPGSTRIVLVIEQNDFPLVADFRLFPDADSYISTLVKLDAPTGTFNIRAIVSAKGIFYSNLKQVRWYISE